MSTRIDRHPMDRCDTYIGRRYGRLVVESLIERRRTSWGNAFGVFLCRCDCGQTKETTSIRLNTGHTRSCGCLRKEALSKITKKHGWSGSRTYNIWKGVVARGLGKKAETRYFKKGIVVCERWLKFENFLEDMGECPKDHSIDRINNLGVYEPGNCRWATNNQQARNRSNTRFFEFEGRMVAAADLAERFGLSTRLLKARILTSGWSVEDAVSKPVKRCGGRSRKRG